MPNEKRTLAIEARVRDFATKQFKAMGAAIARFAKGVASRVKGIASAVLNLKALFGGFIAFLAIRRAFGFLQDTANQLDFIVKTADRIQATTESLSALTHVADLAGVEFKAFTAGLAVFSKNIEAARRGTVLQKDAFKTLGIDIENLPFGPGGKIDLIELLSQAADGMEKLGEGTEKVDALMTAFGRQGSQLGPLLEQGSAAIRAQADEAQRYGLVFDSGTLARAAAFNDSLTRVAASLRGVIQNVFIEAAPRLSHFFENLSKLIADNRDQIIDFVVTLASTFGEFLGKSLEGLAIFIRKIESIAGPLVAVDGRLAKLRDDLAALETTAQSNHPLFTVSPEQRAALEQQADALRAQIADLELASREGLGSAMLAALQRWRVDYEAFRNQLANAPAPNRPDPVVVTGSRPGKPPDEPPAEDPQAYWGGFIKGAQQALHTWTNATQLMASATNAVVSGAFQAFEDSIAGIITGTMTAKQAFESFARSVLQQIARLIARFVALKVVSLFTGGGQVAAPQAEGGVMQGVVRNVIPLRQYQHGGIARSPQLAVFGEGRQAEAFVPLPDGRTIPVTLRGGGGPTMVINISAVDGNDVHRMLVANRQSILGVYSHALASQQQTRQEIQRVAS